MQLQIKACGHEPAALLTEEAGDVLHAGLPLTLRPHDRMEPLEAAWRALEAENGLSLHQSYDWCRAWVQTHDHDLMIIEGLRGGSTQFILPLEVVRQGPLRTARMIATDFSNINTGLYSEAFRETSSPRQLLRALEDMRGQLARTCDLLLLEKMPLEWRGRASPFAALPSVINQNAAFQLAVFDSFERTLEQINAKRRRKRARNSERRLAATGGYDHVIAEPGEDALALLDLFFRQKAARFEAMGLPDVFREERTRSFFRALASAPAANGNRLLQLHALRLKGEHEGHVAAITGLSRKGDHVICQFGSIDDSVAADASPGDFLFHIAIEKLCGEGVRLFDFGIGDQLYKRSWCPIETAQHDLLWPVTLAGRAAATLHRAKAATKRLIKQNPQIYSFVQRLRFGKAEPAGSATAAD